MLVKAILLAMMMMATIVRSNSKSAVGGGTQTGGSIADDGWIDEIDDGVATGSPVVARFVGDGISCLPAWQPAGRQEIPGAPQPYWSRGLSILSVRRSSVCRRKTQSKESKLLKSLPLSSFRLNVP